ncbi:MAG: hypothetical protein ED556_00670 [Winogradskyella sp.]|uniref:C1 family peptidase n=1 Tax=Winogradskyella sp. TaxID=1883156 RepID=UPI000F3E575A|nr:C1 family peptidase [Winogradskyella sp.]RNC87735.1 MAG: hypothetical protein ED556_00670 [Winogradskyella sp.]
MKGKHTFFIIAFLCYHFLASQTNEERFVQSMAYGDSKSALEYFNHIENKESLKSDIHYYASIAYAKANDLNNALEQLNIATDKGLANIEIFNDGTLDTLKTISEYAKIESKLVSNKEMAMQELSKLHDKLIYKYNSDPSSSKVELEMTPAKHQGNRNTCSAFAATSIAEYILKDELGDTIDLSESYNYYISKKKALSNSFLKKAYEPVDGLAGYLALEGYKYGTAQETKWNYEQNNWLNTNDEKCKKNQGVPNVECFTGMPPDGFKPMSKTFKTIFIPFKDIGDFLLSEKKPVLVNIWLYRNGIDMETGELRIPPKDNEQLMGGHVIVITGYDSEKQEYTFKNSWGSSWGTNGFGTMPKAYLENHYEASKSLPFNLDASIEEKEYLAKVSLGSSLILE